MKRIIQDLHHRGLFVTANTLQREITPDEIKNEIIKEHKPQLIAFANKLSAIGTPLPNSVIIDGDDDWFAPRLSHPDRIAGEAGIKILALFHSGVSGISKSGIVIDQKQLKKFISTFHKLVKDDEWTNRLKPNFPSTEKPIRWSIKIIKPNNNEENLYFVSKGWIKK